MRLFAFIALAVLAAAYWLEGWRVGCGAVVLTIAAYTCGALATREQIEASGYVLSYGKDGRGKRRWRVGLKESPTPPTWIVPPGAP